MRASRRLAFLLLVASAPAFAAEVAVLEVGERDRNYYVRYEATLQADAAAVMAVLTDYPSYPQLDPRILEAQLVDSGTPQRILYTRLKGCLGSVFCKSMDRYESLQESPSKLVATAIAGRGDLVSGRTETRVEALSQGCRVSYTTEFEPAFWMPRWLVRYPMRKTLSEGTRAMFEAVEVRARELREP